MGLRKKKILNQNGKKKKKCVKLSVTHHWDLLVVWHPTQVFFFRTTEKPYWSLHSDVWVKNTNLKTRLWYIHSNITDDISSLLWLEKLFQDLEAMKQGVRLMEVVFTAITTVRGKKLIRQEKETFGKYDVFLSTPYLQLRTQSISGSLGLCKWNTYK